MSSARGLPGSPRRCVLSAGPREIVLHEAARQAGGRCRSFYDPALGMTIDNGNHLLLSGNHDARNFLAATGRRGSIGGAAPGSRVCFRRSRNQGALAPTPECRAASLVDFSALRRVPGTGARDYLDLPAAFCSGRRTRRSARSMRCDGLLYERLWRPFFSQH